MTNQPWNDEDFDMPHLDPEDNPDFDLKDLLNKIDRGIIGIEKPRTEHVIVPWTNPGTDWYEQDNNPASPLEQDLV